jgi:hypothetical protein
MLHHENYFKMYIDCYCSKKLLPVSTSEVIQLITNGFYLKFCITSSAFFIIYSVCLLK